MQGLINYNNITNPMAGDQISASLPIQQNEFMRNSRLIPGRGIKINQTPGGLIIETYDTNKTFSTGVPKLADAVVGTIEHVFEDGSYAITFNEGDEPVKYNMAYEINSLVDVVDTYNEKDKILCFPVLMPEVAMGEF